MGLEPTTLRLRVSCSTDWASRAGYCACDQKHCPISTFPSDPPEGKNKNLRARPGFEPGTSRTLSENHTPRPTSRRTSAGPSYFFEALRSATFTDTLCHVGSRWYGGIHCPSSLKKFIAYTSQCVLDKVIEIKHLVNHLCIERHSTAELLVLTVNVSWLWLTYWTPLC